MEFHRIKNNPPPEACSCGNPAKIICEDKPMCWKCFHKYRGQEWITKYNSAKDEK